MSTDALIPYIVAVTAVFGLLIGSFLNVVAYRVPAKISLLRESRCPRCDAPVRPWQNVPVLSWLVLRGECHECHRAISVRSPIVEGLTATMFAAVSWWFLISADSSTSGWATALTILAFVYFAAVSILLALIDLDTHRLPNAIVLPSYVVAAVTLATASFLSGDFWSLLRAGIGMVMLFAFYAALRMVRPGAMGGGDVKLAGLIGIYLGFLGWGALAVGAFAAFVFGGIFGVALMAARRAGRRTAIPFGPWMLLGAWAGVFAGEAVGSWYVGLYSGS